MMNLNDNVPIVLPPGTTRPILRQRIKLAIKNNDKAPLDENIQKVMLKLKGDSISRSGLDLVVILDVSNSMEGGKFEELQKAMQFVIKNLSAVNRLSIVKYNSDAKRVCPLRQMTESTKTELQNLINDLFPKWDDMNITDGLMMALKILNDRSVNSGRVGAIMLISGGEENIGNAASVPLGNVPVHTFGFGNLHDPKVLKAIASNSLGGTYSDVRMNNMTLAFSQCLGGLLYVVTQDLTVTISQIKDNSTIRQVSAGSYPQSMDNTAGSITITFGHIYDQETRKVLVDLHLPSTRIELDTKVLEVSYTYKFNGELYKAQPKTVTICRMSRLTAEEQQAPPEVRAEEVHLLIAEAIKQAIDIFDADEEDLKSAQDKLEDGLLKLEDADADADIEELKAELKELFKLLHTNAINKMHARPFAYSLLISLATQRHMARGKNIRKFQLFATPIMQRFLADAKFHDTMSLKFDDEDPIVLPADSGTTRPTVPGRIQLLITKNNMVPYEESVQKVMLKLTGEEESRSGLDLVVVLDVSMSMEGEKLEELQTAMQFLIKKLSVVDRLSIVKCTDTERLCPLLQMTESTQTELQNLINDLYMERKNMNITDGLLMALKILDDRLVSSARVGAIMLISGGKETKGNAAAVPVGNMPVHTFGFGKYHDPKVLKAIANNSLGGTYSAVYLDNMILAFSQCLGGLLSVVAQDLTVTINQIKDNSTIRQVSAGSYPQSMDNTAGSVTITFGDIYIQEIRKVLVDLHLPSTTKKQDADVLEVSYTYKFNGELFEAKPVTVTVCRMSRLTAEEQQAPPEVRAEEVRLLIAEAIKQAIDIFDADEDADTEDTDDKDADEDAHLKSAKRRIEGCLNKLENCLLKLEDADIDELKAELRTELKELLKLLHALAFYHVGTLHPFAYSLLISLATQRQTARGNNIGKFQLFSTPAMQEFLEEAKIFESFNDNEPDDLSSSGSETKPIMSGEVKLEITSNNVASPEKNIQKVLLELSGEESSDDELDLVAVLDVSSSMEGDKFEKMKMAMMQVIDRAYYNNLSIVEYSSKAKKLCPLRRVTGNSEEIFQNLIIDLECQSGTNITDGLETALNVLKDRSVSSGRVGVIILMSDGEQNQGGDAADFPVGNVPVLTFDFGKDHAEVLIAIANNSGLGGTYTEVCMDKLNFYFHHCLDEVLRVVVWDLTVTVNQKQNESTVICASAGRSLQSIDNATGSVTITLGTLYKKEPHYVLVDILLPVTKADHEAHVLEVSYTYRSSFDGERSEARPATVTVRRMSNLTEEEQQPKLRVTYQEARLLIAEMIKKATSVADKEDLKSLRDKLVHNLKSMRDTIIDNDSINTDNEYVIICNDTWRLKREVEELSELMQSEAINENLGRSSAYSLLISHYTQRSKKELANFLGYPLTVTPASREFFEEAMMYDDIDDLLVYMDRFFCAIQSIEMIIDEYEPESDLNS